MYALNVALTPTTLDAIKFDLSGRYPDIKSSHRCEALGRGLGHRTYAALLAAMRESMPITVAASGTRFCAYLTERGVEAIPDYFYWSVARLAIASVLETEPKLSSWGYGLGPRERKDDGEWMTRRDLEIRFATYRQELLSDMCAEEFLQAKSFLTRMRPTEKISNGANSYSLKHIAENDAGQYPDGEPINTNYVSNGAMIVAAVHTGYRYKTHRDGIGGTSLNVSFNMPKKLVTEVDKQIRG